eukprot:1158169-Pelagomonas_calceolata.AAC.3
MRTDVLRLPGQSKECPLACSVLNDFCGALLNVGRVPDFYTTTITQSENPEAAAESSAPAQLKDALLLHQTIGGCLCAAAASRLRKEYRPDVLLEVRPFMGRCTLEETGSLASGLLMECRSGPLLLSQAT